MRSATTTGALHHRNSGLTTVMITHDMTEAILLATACVIAGRTAAGEGTPT